MANPSPTRLSPAELRKRLLAPPTDTAIRTTDEATPALPRMPARREGGRYGNAATQSAIDLEALMVETPQTMNPRLTPMPEARLDPVQFRYQQEQPPQPYAPPQPYGGGSPYDEINRLRMQNAELHRIVEEMKPVLEEASAAEQRSTEKENRYDAQITEKDKQIAELQASLNQLAEQLANVPAPRIPKTRDELEEWSDELEKEGSKIELERRRMGQDRQQLREDEEALEKQMRDMEVAMARERAMIARQETELKRLSAEIQHELEVLQRGDGTLREQLSKFQRRHEEVISHAPAASSRPAAPMPAAPSPVPLKRDSGLLRRIFRGGK